MDMRLDYTGCEMQLTQKSLHVLYQLKGCISFMLDHSEVIPSDLQTRFRDFHTDIAHVIDAREDKRMTQVNPPTGDSEIGNLDRNGHD